MIKKRIAFLVVILLTACSAQPTLPEEAQLTTMVAKTLTAHPSNATPIPTSTPTEEFIGADAVPSDDTQIVSDVIACSAQDGLALFTIAENTPYRDWDQMYISINQALVVCSEQPGSHNTLTCEFPPETTFPANVLFVNGNGIAGRFSFNSEDCHGDEFEPTLSLIFTTTNAQNVNLRTNPGLLFAVSRVMAQGTRLRVLSLSPGIDWAYVRNDEGVNGWVDLNFVEIFPRAQLALIEPNGIQRVSGTVFTVDGRPMPGINFSITQGNLRTDAKTNMKGEFYAYLPASASGAWTVAFLSIDAGVNPMTKECAQDRNVCSTIDPLNTEVTLPNASSISFIWK